MLEPRCYLPVLLIRFATVKVSYPKWSCGPSYKYAIPPEPSFAYLVAILSIFGRRKMPWYPWGWPRMGLYSSGRDYRIPKHLMGPIVRTFVTMMFLSTGNIVFPIFNIGGTVASWLLFSINLLWIIAATVCICVVGKFRLFIGAYDPTVRLFALTMMAGWWCLAAINFTFMTTAICRCYQGDKLDYCALFGVGNSVISAPLVMRISDTQWTLFSWMVLVLMMCATSVPGWDWMYQHWRIRERIRLSLEPR
ncbi:hypothetical protein BGZ61DRAFT_39635 [Ilyonectria robusta]|uniref:uncharacterized protein n=1 Tax=Ilyonectria robusta TaxID=1079257 RepID=UPI001E8EA1AA|nr:uncharacterized protein BGZ61DRAFT_39635 [Ilyonectria robusta]KAH8688164.1 hypothetical protein BGZ61DRAFT_39635 [Ilyonectria robusta]